MIFSITSLELPNRNSSVFIISWAVLPAANKDLTESRASPLKASKSLLTFSSSENTPFEVVTSKAFLNLTHSNGSPEKEGNDLDDETLYKSLELSVFVTVSPIAVIALWMASAIIGAELPPE
ncbi:hypothetical protein QAD02_002398 [Eretmocerus hayati]|uniref:Uncharacterized protein n=1 Tax=Eretmocerus hayati TaxID=131215 RepID=A0ACC2NIS2_9HYME|nr:hypothetical protein QAD02_002398 [Eretmocerus hayati]